jgi:3-keto-disaccharide hydrolase
VIDGTRWQASKRAGFEAVSDAPTHEQNTKRLESGEMKHMNRLDSTGRWLLAVLLALVPTADGLAQHNVPPQGFVALFNGSNLDGWWGATTENPRGFMALPPKELAAKKSASLEDIGQHWRVEKGELVNDGKGLYLTTDKFYGDFELLASYKMAAGADSGIYLRGTPQVSIWDATDESKFKHGADQGSGGLWNNPSGSPGKDPLVFADQRIGAWEVMRVVMTGERVSVWLNDKLVVDHARMHNYFSDKAKPETERLPLPQVGPIQLQTHGGEMRWRNLFIRQIGPDEANKILASKNDQGFQSIFNGKDLTGWTGATENYMVEQGAITCKPDQGGTLFTEKQYGDFVVRLEFKLPPAGNNGLAIRYPGVGHGTWDSFCELQVLDDGHPMYNDSDHPKFYDLNPRQAHGSVYARVPAHRGYLRPTGQWNFQECTLVGPTVKVELNGFVILEADVSKAEPATFMYPMDHFKGRDLMRGHFGFNGHNDPVQFRALRIK